MELRISVRADAALKERIKKVEERVGINETTLVRRSLEALLDYIEEHGSVQFPIQVVPQPTKRPKKSG